MDLTSIAAVVYAAVTAASVAFQLALALGAPWGEYAMGGRSRGRLPAPLRVGAVLQAVILGLMALVVLSRAGLVLPTWAAASARWIGVVVTVAVASAVLNAMTRSVWERRIWLPVTLVLVVSSLTVALAG